jgi:2-polyprenyl-6-hydroxyphenyl methylase/3-demethylubiquinone-9 3-methyltransferase
MATLTTPPRPASDAHAAEVAAGQRFEFGKNWRRFLETVDEAAIGQSRRGLAALLGTDDLRGRTFLDIGSGSGLSSLSAYRMGADVTSFDYDPDSVGCTQEMHRRYDAGDGRWRVMQGSVLDAAFMASLGTFDVVYSWGVLHHTGRMWDAIWNAAARVAPGGTFFIAIYNDQGAWSHRWARIKRFYCSGPLGKAIVSSAFIPYWIVRNLAADVVWMRNPLARYTEYKNMRGMSVYHDWHDWLGGYPFEFATPEALILPLQSKGFTLTNLVTARGTVGCIELVMRKDR